MYFWPLKQKKQKASNVFIHTKLDLRPSLFIPERYGQLKTWTCASELQFSSQLEIIHMLIGTTPEIQHRKSGPLKGYVQAQMC